MHASTRSTTHDGDFDRARMACRMALTASVLLGVLALAEAVAAWPQLPERVPTHFGASGKPDAWSDRSVASVFVLPVMALVVGPGVALLGALSVMPGHRPPPDRPRLRAALPPLAIFMGVTGLLSTLLVASISHGAVQVALGRDSGIGWFPLVGGILLGVWALVGAAWFVVKHSPLGASEEAEAERSADPAAWKWGLFYVAPDDPALFVEKRWGGGYTINFGIPAGRRIGWGLIVFTAFVLGMVAWLVLAS